MSHRMPFACDMIISQNRSACLITSLYSFLNSSVYHTFLSSCSYRLLFRRENFALLIVSALLSTPEKSHHSNYRSCHFVSFPRVMFLGSSFEVVSCQSRSIALPLREMSRMNCSFYFYPLVLHLNMLNT